MDEYPSGYGDILGADASSGGASGGWGDWGNMMRDTVGYAARSYIDAEVNAPIRLEERKLAMRGENGGLFGAGDVESAANAIGGNRWLPWLLLGGAALAVVMIVRS